MASGGVRFTGGETDPMSGIESPAPTADGVSFENRWQSLVEHVTGHTHRAAADDRLSPDHYRTAVRLTREFPDDVRVRGGVAEDFGEMGSHVRGHFDDLFNDDGVCPEFKRARPETDTLFELAELVYLHDASSRFAVRTDFEPRAGGMEAVTFVELPESVAGWLDEVDRLWEAAHGQVELTVSEMRDRIADLYGRREAYVRRAMANDTFLPVVAPGDVPSDRPDVATRMRRGSVDPKRVHAYLFERVSALM